MTRKTNHWAQRCGLSIVATLVFAQTAWGQASAPRPEPALKLHLAAKRINSPVDGPSGLHWVPDPYPGNEDVLVSNPALAKTLRETLATLANDPLCKGAWVLDKSQTCTFGEKIQLSLRGFMFMFVTDLRIIDAPDSEGQRLDITLRANYSLPVAQEVESIAAAISTHNAQLGVAGSLSLSVEEAARRLGIVVPPGVPGTERILIRFSEQDRKRPAPLADFPMDSLQNELFGVGLKVLEIAAAHGLALGKTAPPNDKALTDLDDAINKVYQVERPPWPAVARTAHEGGKYTVELKNLRFVARVDAEVLRGQIPSENGATDFVGSTAAGELKIVEILRAASDNARAFVDTHSTGALEGRIPTRDNVLEAIEALRNIPKTQGPYDVRSSNGAIVLQATYKWLDASVDGKIDLQTGYTVEQLFTGGGELRGHNLLGTVFQRDLKDDWEFNAAGGPESQRATLNLNIARSRGTWSLWTGGAALLAHVSRDRNQRMGNLPTVDGQNDKDTQLTDQESGLQPKVFLQHEFGGRWKNRVRVEPSLDWRHVLVHPSLDSVPAIADGGLTAWVANVQETFGHDFTPAGSEEPGMGFSDVGLALNGEARQATHALGGDFGFHKQQASLTADGVFGWRTRRELLVRQTFGGGSSSPTTPIFQLYRLGGTDNVRGIEEGEFVGRRLRFHQSTVGIALPVVFPSLGDAKGALAALANSFIELFYDHGYIAQDAARKYVHGYGVAVEIRGLPAGDRHANIAIGWAKSPQSVLHRKGTMTLGVNCRF